MPLLLPHFPPHKTWIEPFFGSGSAFFNKPKAQYNIVNDLDSDVFNLFQVIMNHTSTSKGAEFEHNCYWGKMQFKKQTY